MGTPKSRLEVLVDQIDLLIYSRFGKNLSAVDRSDLAYSIYNILEGNWNIDPIPLNNIISTNKGPVPLDWMPDVNNKFILQDYYEL